MNKSEAQIQKEIMDLLEERMYNKGDLWVSRLHPGYAFKNTVNVIKLSPKGSPDILVIFKGKTYGFEVKTIKGRQRTDQKEMQKLFKKIKADYHVVRSAKAVKEMLKI